MPYAKAIETFSQTSMKRFYNPLMWSDKIFFRTKMGKEMLDACNTVHEAVRKVVTVLTVICKVYYRLFDEKKSV